ncbi:class I ribonucleotide reductase maintenance protein YfaE [Vibrio panuliri]|uniref:(2Fe-2S)-binding protein n=1 Tax=Vibrio panuliri TaxID=1381081 RepID=A0A1Q9HIP5_9VIBR|nr:class I ribonucleotide reductase maintenance protein YfaE [Vibrio panuliri]KAB1454287.1 2Fe-2S ferredoxin-like protein [Vibrio panuliri]OLQ86508.1 (2Fe-2S)-binding protein [Vibrio panuliri]OLQ90179.1 (2Fe-2S)-binding protein [Vibrio panuliri]
MARVKINGTTTIVSNSSNTLLESLENAGVEVEYNCRDGHCGACRCKLKSGEVEYVGFAMAYTQADEILPCITRAKSDIELDEVVYKLKEKRA